MASGNGYFAWRYQKLKQIGDQLFQVELDITERIGKPEPVGRVDGVKELGFKWKRSQGRRKVIIERYDIVDLRCLFLFYGSIFHL
jgi:hypothetical protein